MLSTFEKRCQTGSDFIEKPTTSYRPCDDGVPPNWWKTLNLAAWQDLLEENEILKPNEVFKVELNEPLLNAGKGHPNLIQSTATFNLKLLPEHNNINIEVHRRVGRKTSEYIGQTSLSKDGWTFEDTPPQHSNYVEYIFSGEDAQGQIVKDVKIKLISLETNETGVFAHCRNAKHAKPFKPKKVRGKTKELTYECQIELSGMGLHQLDIYSARELEISEKLIGHDVTREGGQDAEELINRSSPTFAVASIETDEECSYVFQAIKPNGENLTFHVELESGEEAPVSTSSEFERLVFENQKEKSRPTSGTSVAAPTERCSNLQQWLLEDENSYFPLIIGPDFKSSWTLPDWNGKAIISDKELLQDPRPSKTDMLPPESFLNARSALMKKLSVDNDGFPTLIEEVKLGELMKEKGDESFSSLIDEYLKVFLKWLNDDYQAAVWTDVILACKSDSSSDSLNPNPYAIILTPMHPIRLAWHCQTQKILKETLDGHKPCPAASILDPSTFPDCLSLPMKETSGKEKNHGFLSIRSSSDYWQVLWNCDYLDDLFNPEENTLFCSWFGITIDGLSAGFSASQVKKSIEDIKKLFPAKSQLRLSLESDSTGLNSCNDGIEEWASESLGPCGTDKGFGDPWYETGPLSLSIFDNRPPLEQPSESNVSRISELSGGCLRWFDGKTENLQTDLAIIAHLGTANPKMEKYNVFTPIDEYSITRWRIRRQTGEDGRFISETRIGNAAKSSSELSKNFALITEIFENSFEEIGDSYVFAPNLPRLNSANKKATYCAVSSSSLDPACFFGQTGSYFLWDYELPSFSKRAGENSGYYLLATPSESMRKAIENGVKMLGTENINQEMVDNLLREISTRGMPTLKRLTAGGSTALGELGTLITLRILQGDFTTGTKTLSIAPVKDSEARSISLIVPVDPFTSQIDSLRKSLGKYGRERPDLLILKIKFSDDNVALSLKITPLEVKTRSGKLSLEKRKEALNQATSFSDFLSGLKDESDKWKIWAIAQRHLYGSWLDYGFRVYGQINHLRNDSEWTKYHQTTLSCLLSGSLNIQICKKGRLVVIDGSNQSDKIKTFDDEVDTLVITHGEAAQIIQSPETSIINNIVNSLGDWGFSVTDEKQNSFKPTSSGEIIKTKKEELNSSQNSDAAPLVQQNQVSHKELEVQSPDSKKVSQINTGVKFEVGESIGGFSPKKFNYHPSNTELKHLNIGVIGDMGAGKTQLLQSLLYNLSRCKNENRGISPNVLIFDYKKDYSEPSFVEATGARIIDPREIPLNLFDITYSTSTLDPIIEKISFFGDVLDKIFSGIGHTQRQKLKESIKLAYEISSSSDKIAPTLKDVFKSYKEALGESIDSVYGIMSDLVDRKIFTENAHEAIPFKEFFKGVVVINLGALGSAKKMKNMLVAIFLNLFYEHMLNIDKRGYLGSKPKLRALDSFLLVDEAENIMRYDFEVLKDILLQGREFGVGVILASQYPQHFKTQNVKYAENLRSWFIHQVPDISVKELQSMGFTNIDEQTVQRIKELGCHECLYRTLGIDDGRFMRGTPFFEISASKNQTN